jgi:hypothetical protein
LIFPNDSINDLYFFIGNISKQDELFSTPKIIMPNVSSVTDLGDSITSDAVIDTFITLKCLQANKWYVKV